MSASMEDLHARCYAAFEAADDTGHLLGELADCPICGDRPGDGAWLTMHLVTEHDAKVRNAARRAVTACRRRAEPRE